MDKIEIKKFGREELGLLRVEIQSALDSIKDKYQLSELTITDFSFTPANFKAKITGNINTPEVKDYLDTKVLFFTLQYGLPENLIGTSFDLNDETFIIEKIEPKNTKYPIIATNLIEGKGYKFSVSEIKKILDKPQ
jgi:hypothetical protein